MMRRVIWKGLGFAVIALTGVGAAFLLSRSSNHEKPSSLLPSSSQDHRSASERKLFESFAASRDITLLQLDEVGGQCRRYWIGILQYQPSAHPPPEELKRLYEGLESTGCENPPQQLALFHKLFQTKCSIVQDSTEVQNCLLRIFQYRAKIADWLTEGVSLSKLSDVPILLDILYARFTDSRAASDPLWVVGVAERLLELRPDFYLPAAAATTAYLLNAHNIALKKPQDPAWQKFDSSLERARKLIPSDLEEREKPRLLEQQLLSSVFRHSQFHEVGREAQRLQALFPDSGKPNYYRAWSLYREGKKDQAIDLLRQIKQKQNEFPRAERTLGRIAHGEKEPFEANFEVSFPFQFSL